MIGPDGRPAVWAPTSNDTYHLLEAGPDARRRSLCGRDIDADDSQLKTELAGDVVCGPCLRRAKDEGFKL